VAGAINRVDYHESLETRRAPVNPAMLVVGAGMQAALGIASAGNKVFLVAQITTVGGHMLQFNKIIPTPDWAACIGTSKVAEVAQNPTSNCTPSAGSPISPGSWATSR
jgi:heterodisulfide reductase subunit A2